MKVLFLSTIEREGGAARAAHRLYQGFLAQGLDAYLLVQSKSTDDPRVHAPRTKLDRAISAVRPSLDQLPRLLQFRPAPPAFSFEWLPEQIAAKASELQPDILHLHWIAKGFVQIETLARLNFPLVWTLHDMWPMTGGCHYSGECSRYQAACGGCPQLDSRREKDLSRWVWTRKQKAWRRLPLTLVAPSRWMAECARRSSLFAGRRIEVIANGIDTVRYRPFDRRQARELLGLPGEKRLVLFSAAGGPANPNKGFPHLAAALKHLAADQDWKDRVELVMLGVSAYPAAGELPVKVHCLGHLHDDVSMRLAYAAADVFAAPSVQDNLPNTVMEAMACGIPSVAFQVGGLPDLIDHQLNGWLAPAFDAQALSQGISWILQDQDRWQRLSAAARLKVETEYDQTRQAQRYLDLFTEILEL